LVVQRNGITPAGITKQLLKKFNSSAPLSILVVDELGGGNSIQLANDIAATGASVYLLHQFFFKIRLPKSVILLPRACLSPTQLLGSIDSAVKSHCPDIILPISEETLHRIWDESPVWLPLVHPFVEPDLRVYYRNRHHLASFMSDRGVLIPDTHQLEVGSAEEVLFTIDKLNLPVVVKGARGEGGEQVRIVETSKDAIKAVFDLFAATGTYPALQEYIEGPTYQVGGLFEHGRPIRLLAGEKTEMHPPGTGPAISLRSCKEPELIDAAIMVFAALGHTGIAGADFVRGADGHFRFLEVNPRVWGSWGFAKVLGIDLFGPWCGQLRGDHLTTSIEFPPGRSWAKMPEYLLVSPKSRKSIFRRALHPLAIRSWSWRDPYVLLLQLRRAFWAFMGSRKGNLRDGD
jgi:hypothetical protein